MTNSLVDFQKLQKINSTKFVIFDKSIIEHQQSSEFAFLNEAAFRLNDLSININ
jgi:hypothetical protein